MSMGDGGLDRKVTTGNNLALDAVGMPLYHASKSGKPNGVSLSRTAKSTLLFSTWHG